MTTATSGAKWLIRIAAVVLFAAAAGAVWAQEDEASHDARQGQMLFREYCRSCHGNRARGDGPVAEHLSPKPADLTGIKERNDGVFPAEKVHDAISLGKDIAGHGNSEMPVWGDAFKKVRGGKTKEEVENHINALVAYLETIQR